MREKNIFIFEAIDGMVLSKDIVLDDGHLIAVAETILTLDLIERISNFHVLEIWVMDEALDPESKKDSPTYLDQLKKSETFIDFKEKYNANISDLKDNLNKIISGSSSTSIDTESLLIETSAILNGSHSSLHILDMLNCMRDNDDATFVHSINVGLISSIIGQWLEFSPEDIEIFTLCGLLHDIGKLLMPNEILFKPGKLTEPEFEVIKTHVNLGYNIIKDQVLDTRVKEACLLHHERCDGTGYPFGLTGEKIPVAAKILAIADVFDAMTSNRVYRNSICPFEVIRLMESDAYSQLDPKYLIPFLNKVVATYLHNNVKLSNGSIGEIILINTSDLSRPVVKCGQEFIDLSKQRNISIVNIL